MEVFMKIDDILVIVFLLVSLFAIYKIIRCCVGYIRRYGILAFIIGIVVLAGAVAGIAWAIDRYINTIIPIAVCIFVLYAFFTKRNAETDEAEAEIEETQKWIAYEQEREYYEKHFGNKG